MLVILVHFVINELESVRHASQIAMTQWYEYLLEVGLETVLELRSRAADKPI